MSRTARVLSVVSSAVVLTWASAQAAPPGIGKAELLRGLVLHYSFDADEGGTVTDKTARGNHGVVRGATFTPNGRRGGAYSFDGRRQYIEITNTRDFFVTASHRMTVAAWIKNPRLQGAHVRIFSTGSADWTSGYWIGFEGGSPRPQFQMSDGVGIGVRFEGTSPIRGDRQWHHIVGVMDGPVAHLYVDGRLESSIGLPGQRALVGDLSREGPIPPAGRPRIGMSYDGETGSAFEGLIDEVMVYNRPLAEEEVKALYDLQSGRPSSAPEPAAEEEAIRPGDWVKVIKGPAPVKVGEKTLTVVEVGVELTALKVQGKWVQVRVETETATVKGWIDISSLARVRRAAGPSALPYPRGSSIAWVRDPLAFASTGAAGEKFLVKDSRAEFRGNEIHLDARAEVERQTSAVCSETRYDDFSLEFELDWKQETFWTNLMVDLAPSPDPDHWVEVGFYHSHLGFHSGRKVPGKIFVRQIYRGRDASRWPMRDAPWQGTPPFKCRIERRGAHVTVYCEGRKYVEFDIPEEPNAPRHIRLLAWKSQTIVRNARLSRLPTE